MRNLHYLIDATEFYVLVAPVKLIRLAGRKTLRDERFNGTPPRVVALHVPAHAIDRAGVALDLQRFV
ncbi:MAG TPA: hypothetical protein VGN07_07730 [Steroidobacteraceae bacterium]|jgi:hypothetical protein